MDLESLKKEVITHWGISVEIEPVYGEKDLNFILSADAEKYILKLHHPDTSVRELEAQNHLLTFLQKAELEFEVPVCYPDKEGELIRSIEFKGLRYNSRILNWIEGSLWSEMESPPTGIYSDLGSKLGLLSNALKEYPPDLFDNGAKWDPSQLRWITDHTNLFSEDRQRCADYFLALFESEHATISKLRKSVIYMDANDNNIIVDGRGQRVIGFIDFGDATYSETVNELAVGIAYAAMNLSKPLDAARELVRSYNEEFPLTESELEVLYILVAARLLISVTFSALRKESDPTNEYLQVSEQPAWNLLEKWRQISPIFALAAFRFECGLEPIPGGKKIEESIKKAEKTFLFDFDPQAHSFLDLSVGSLELGNNAHFHDWKMFENRLNQKIEREGVSFLVGGYLEPRAVYTTDSFIEEGNKGREWRTVHLGHDFWVPHLTPIRCPYDAEVVSAVDNEGPGNYGPTIILRHELEAGDFYTLYGHLSRESILALQPGDKIKRGDFFASTGKYEENGNWVPHLHFQLMLDLLGGVGDFDGVALYSEKDIFAAICPDPGLVTGIEELYPTSEPELIKDHREEVLSKSLSLSYSNPLYIVRGFMQHLYDHTGRRFLDTVNNVAHVGHEHPHVVEALIRQSSVLNTNTRYLHHGINQYAERLLSLFSDDLDVCFLVNSGSEANELALRIAKTVTGREEMVALEMGYHGNTGACVDVSSYKFDRKGGKGKPEATTILSSPDVFRYPERRYSFSEEMTTKLSSVSPAAVIAESILSCAGQVVPPEGYFKELHSQIRSKGGLFIADEVQVGFGRVGEHMWGFELHDIKPDIVTLGKPIGNGHPLGAVITTREIADRFANGMEYFNTYGGNPVSSAVGTAVLDVLTKEELQSNAQTMGQLIGEGLNKIREDFPIIADVRGHGLFLGFELAENGIPATEKANYLVNSMRERGILMSTDGPDENVIKIKPPMCINSSNVDYLLDQLRKVMSDLYMNS